MSKPKGIRSCAFCGIKDDKSKLLRINLPSLCFDFYQNNNFRSFYICQNIKCITKVLKKRSMQKYICEDIKNDEKVIINNITDIFSGIICMLFERSNIKDCEVEKSKSLILCREDAVYTGSNIMSLGEALYKGSEKLCVVNNKMVAKKLMNYKNIIRYINGYNGELNGSKES